MNEEKEDPILAAPNPVKDESIPMETNNIDSTSDEKDKISLSYDQRRISLLNNPTYGVILAFLDKFRGNIDIQDYPLHLLEENLLSDEENISRRLIDFHLTLLKRISLGKGAQRDKFVSIITKFAYRFDFDDGDYLQINGYSHAQIDIKLRILKNLLETQFDHNQAFKTALVEKPSFEIRSQAFGRDRSGAFYWLFMDTECFIRLFRENTDDDRTWTYIATDKDELENFMKILLTDNILRKKFPDWKFTHEPFNSMEPSNEFQERYAPLPVTIKKEDIKSPTPPLSPIVSRIKLEKKATTKSKKVVSPPPVIKTEVHSDQESSNSGDKTDRRSPVPSTEQTNANVARQEINNNQEDEELKSPTRKSRTRRKSATWSKKKRRTISNTSKKDEQEEQQQEILPTKSPTKGRKRKQIIMDDEDIPVTKKNDETSQDKDNIPILMDDDSNCNDLPIALRRSRRVRKAPTTELPSITSSPTKSASQVLNKKKLTNGKGKTSSQPTVKTSSQSHKSKSKSKSKNGRKRRRGGKSSANGVSSSSEDEHQPSEEDEDEYNSDDYLPTNRQSEEFDEDELLEEEDDKDEEFVPRRSAKTVAKRRGQMNENNIEDSQSTSSACCICSKTDRPEALLLCDDCDDPYHLECLKPILLAVPDGDWYCPLCEQKRFSDKLVEKFIQLIKEYEELEVKRKQCMSKRTNRLANVMLNLDRMVKRSSKKRRTNGIAYSDEENEEEEEEEEENNDNRSEEEEDDDSVYGFKDDGNIEGAEKSKRPSSSSRGRRDRHEVEEPHTLGVRSCRRKPQNYRFDDYDKKMKAAMLESGVEDEDLDKESDVSDGDDKKSTKKRAGYEKDEEFEGITVKQDDEFAPDENNSDASDSEEEEEDYNDDETSEDEDWKGKRRSSTRKKPITKSNRRKSRNKSDDDEDDDDDSLSDTELSRFQTANTTKSETNTDCDLNDTGNDDIRRSSRTASQRNYAKQQDDSNDDDDEDLFENGRPPPRRMRYKKRHGSDDSFVDDDDDYEKLQRKRKIVKYGKVVSRSSITDHLKNFVDEDQEQEESKQSASASQDGVKEPVDDNSKEPNKVPPTESNEPQQSDDDDDFPDEQEIFKANGLLKLQKTLTAPKPTSFRPAFGAPTHSYQHAIVDPTARFAMIRPPIRPAMNNGYPSNGHDPNLGGETHQPSEMNGHNGPTS
ncbi:hypothetical protein I4U23_000910 [Adineta vaga]|nr:hypothetical protein I4U23_000910 [Adineta vaga]